MKTTKQKEAILAAVCTMRNHPTADEIYHKLKKDNERLSLGTVYRNLSAFTENGDIRKVSVPGFGDRFDFRLDEHEHMYCEKCGRVYDVNINFSVNDVLSNKNNVKITGYKLMLYGLCENCNDK